MAVTTDTLLARLAEHKAERKSGVRRYGVPSRFRSLPMCPHLGDKLPGPCGAAMHRCNLDGAICTPGMATCKDANRHCQTCTLRPPIGLSILLTGGIGDAIALEGTMTPEERDQLTAIYYACPAAAEIEQLFRGLPNLPRLRTHVVLPTGRRVHYSAAAVEGHVGTLPAGVTDWSIAGIFPRGRPYTGSSFLTHPLCQSPAVPSQPFVVLVPHSTWGRWNDRNFNAADWAAAIDTLERYDLIGIVLCREKLPLPANPRILDWQGATSILETIEVLKRAVGYVGIDSGLSVLAAKLFPAARLAIKSVWGHCYAWKHMYFAPRKTYPFLKAALEVPPWT